MLLGVRYAPDVAVLLIALGLQVFIANTMVPPGWRSHWVYRLVLAFSSALLGLSILLTLAEIFDIGLPTLGSPIRGIVLAWAIALVGAGLIAGFVSPVQRQFSPDRRGWLTNASRLAIAAPLAGVGFGMFIQRRQFRLSEIAVPIPGLPKDLDGLKIVQVSDIHLGPYLAERDLAYVIDMANETKAQAAVVTGDLISVEGDPIDDAIRQVARIKSDAGTFGCHGNHEAYAGVLDYASREAAGRGVTILRHRNSRLKFGSSYLNLVGVDYQRMGSRYLLGVPRLVVPGDTNILLSHNPDVFPTAAHQGFALTLAGHTHGGQINFEILDKNLNISRFFTPYTNGLYREGQSAIYVSTGVGTIGVPVRFGAPPEVALIRLCAT